MSALGSGNFLLLSVFWAQLVIFTFDYVLLPKPIFWRSAVRTISVGYSACTGLAAEGPARTQVSLELVFETAHFPFHFVHILFCVHFIS